MYRKTALVTGAGRGIGRAIAIELAKNGYDVGVNYFHSRERAMEVCRIIGECGGKAVPICADVSDFQQLNQMFDSFFEEFPSIDLLVNNAGISKFYPFLEVTEEQWEEITRTDWKGAFFCTQRAAQNMISQNKSGVIINISSNHADGCWPNANIYAPTKAALTKFGRNAAMELAPYGIRVITAAPGYTDVGWDKSDPIHRAAPKIPLKRFAQPEEIARIIAFLASDACAYMTGNCVTIDGGSLLPILPENDYEPMEELV